MMEAENAEPVCTGPAKKTEAVHDSIYNVSQSCMFFE